MLLISACDKAEIAQTDTEAEIEAQSEIPGEICTYENNPVNDYFKEAFGMEISGFEQYPEDMKCFVAYVVECEHFAGEEGYDEERRKFLNEALNKTCPEAKTRQIVLKNKYKQNADMMKVLAICDDGSSAICAYFKNSPGE
jgi:hypothetical protein